jgi:Lrp/AsnC family transcriptional regulator, leucine-responsive regulatory protein
MRASKGSGRGRGILDEVNVRLLRALLDDPRIPIAELARRVHLSGPTATDRLQRLEGVGVILGIAWT